MPYKISKNPFIRFIWVWICIDFYLKYYKIPQASARYRSAYIRIKIASSNLHISCKWKDGIFFKIGAKKWAPQCSNRVIHKLHPHFLIKYLAGYKVVPMWFLKRFGTIKNHFKGYSKTTLTGWGRWAVGGMSTMCKFYLIKVVGFQ